MSISFVVPLFNHLCETQAMLASLQASLPEELEREIILVDDGSSDGTRAWLATLQSPEIRVHVNPSNLGFARSCNAGVALSKGSLIGLLNNDLLFEPGWLAPMLAVLNNPRLRAGLVGNVQFRVANGKLDHAGVRLNLHGQFEHVRVLPSAERVAVDVSAVTGACLLLRKRDFDAVGGFDERYVNGGEDLDLCFKVRATGQRVYLATRSRIRHHVSLSRKRVTVRDERNSQLLFARWRKEIKHLLAASWSDRLRGSRCCDEGADLGETLTADFVATPHAAGLVIAEAILSQQEQRWARLLDEQSGADGLASRCRFTGFRYDASQRAYALDETAELIVDALPSAINFHACGRVLPLPQELRVQLHLSINGVQHVQWLVFSGGQFNVGLPRPLLLNGVPNRFTLRPMLLDAQGVCCGSASSYLRISHFVVDGETLTPMVAS
jgi:GT2 family glycosyltransferase